MIRVAAGPQPSSVSLSDGTADRQPHPQAIPLGREEGIEKPLEVRRRPDTRVLYADEDAGGGFPLATHARDDQPARARRHLRHRLDPVHDQVQDELLQPDPVSPHREQILGQSLLDHDGVLLHFGLDEAEHLSDQLIDVHERHLAVRLLHERTRMRDHVARPLGVPDH